MVLSSLSFFFGSYIRIQLSSEVVDLLLHLLLLLLYLIGFLLLDLLLLLFFYTLLPEDHVVPESLSSVFLDYHQVFWTYGDQLLLGGKATHIESRYSI